MDATTPIFALYGEKSWTNELDEIHVERIAIRSGLHNWEIRPHRHADLCQVMWVTRGGGVLHIDGRREAFRAPRLMILPAGAVHGFAWEPASDGHVLMTGEALLSALSPPEERALTEQILNVAPPPDLIATLSDAFQRLEAEFARPGVGRRAALHGGLLTVLALLARSAAQAIREAHPVSPDADLVTRFRHLIEARHREHLALEDYCAQLGVTPVRLNRACQAAAGRSPLALIHERLMLEAKRALAYTSLSVAETAYSLGFSDPAYFSRFFREREGVSPRAFRQTRAGE